MLGETSKIYLEHLMAQALSQLKLTSQLDHSPDISVPESRFGDYATNAAMILAKKLKLPPPQVAEKIAEAVRQLDAEGVLAEVSVAGGFLNFRLSQEALVKNLNKVLDQGDLYGCSMFGQGKHVVVEYFQNNVAKPPHVGHLRSAVIGDSLLRILRSQGYKAVSDTHIGDWGTQFGILIWAYKNLNGEKIVAKHSSDYIAALNQLYVEANVKIEADEKLREAAKQEFAKLEKGDAANRELWQKFVRLSLEDFEHYRQWLDVLPFDHNLGESFYEDKMPAVLDDLKKKNLLTESQGAQIVDLQGQKLGVAVLVKSDGATTYLLRDLATVKYRVGDMGISRALYVVDNRQSHHFEQVFEISKLAGYVTDQQMVEHVDFGFMSLPEGAISTRKGTTISLHNLISEAQKRAVNIINDKNPELDNKEAVAKLVALAAIKYFDLSHNRKTEIVFAWDKALSFEGNTGPYLQYTHARIHGILRKATDNKQQITGANALSFTPNELSVLRKLNQYSEVVQQVAQDFLPNQLCNYLFELSQAFNTFYEAVPVLQEKDEQFRAFRLHLITAVAQVIKNGLYLLGIEAPEEM
ncbi:MAG: arginine--tRNA ligase [Patescibacteria group bacterium]|nr:arginine--tRNA ligase [Patescibacteria group bacterium]